MFTRIALGLAAVAALTPTHSHAQALDRTRVQAQAEFDRVLLGSEDPTVREVTFVISHRSVGLRVMIESAGFSTRGDTTTVNVNQVDPAILLLPDTTFRMELRTVQGSAPFVAHLVTRAEPTRYTSTVRGPILVVERDSAKGAPRVTVQQR